VRRRRSKRALLKMLKTLRGMRSVIHESGLACLGEKRE